MQTRLLRQLEVQKLFAASLASSKSFATRRALSSLM